MSENKTALDIAREFFPYSTDEELDYIIWEHTGFPSFWPDSTKTPEENLRAQLQEFKDGRRPAQ